MVRIAYYVNKSEFEMIWTLILGITAGWLAPSVDARVKPFLEKNLPGPALSSVELRAMSLAICLLAAAAVAHLSGHRSGFVLMIGGALGVFGPRLYARFKAHSGPDYDS